MLSTNKLIIGTSRHLTERGYAYAGSGIGSIQGQARRSRSCPGQSLEPAGISGSLHASSGDERGPALEIQAVERTGASGVGEKLALAPWASRRRRELLELLDRMDPSTEELTAAAEQEARNSASS